MFSVTRASVIRWAVVLGVLGFLFGLSRLFLLLCPTRDWAILHWSLEAPTAAAWDSPAIPALVAENAVENGGPVGEWLGGLLYRRTLAPAADSPLSGPPTPYAQVHLPRAWLGTESITWSTKPFHGNAMLVQVFVRAKLPHRVTYGRGCSSMEPMLSLVERDYVTVPTASGWRVASVSTPFPGDAIENAPTIGAGTAAAVLGAC